HGDVLDEEYFLFPPPIIDYWTRRSGIWKQYMMNATPLKIVQSQILKIVTGKTVWGHATHNFKALQYFHPKSVTHNTSQIPLLPNLKADCLKNATMSLKHFTKKLLNGDMQIGKSGLSSVEDAQATMKLHKL
ncbi:hypothetical protein PANDA_018984, partial [Ailuropoda melanoleuca]